MHVFLLNRHPTVNSGCFGYWRKKKKTAEDKVTGQHHSQKTNLRNLRIIHKKYGRELCVYQFMYEPEKGVTDEDMFAFQMEDRIGHARPNVDQVHWHGYLEVYLKGNLHHPLP
ncbi:conserved hypothetical protein [Ricinus communis]|uniref:Uncharacterized protein n=1 Tax=Ricinus communis TaxID=3988 RepID=B9RX82_RICCO|nr:conserved hypothetical protein [Ricinus communis]